MLLRPVLIGLLALPLFGGTAACANEPPRHPAGPVADFADILAPSQEAYLDQELRRYFDENCIAIVVASVASLDGQPIETYANRLARSWQIGSTESQQGVLILVAPNEQRVRIEISRSVNRVLTDDLAEAIIRRDMTPRFQSGDLEGGTIGGATAIVSLLDSTRATDGLDRTSCHAEANRS